MAVYGQVSVAYGAIRCNAMLCSTVLVWLVFFPISE